MKSKLPDKSAHLEVYFIAIRKSRTVAKDLSLPSLCFANSSRKLMLGFTETHTASISYFLQGKTRKPSLPLIFF